MPQSDESRLEELRWLVGDLRRRGSLGSADQLTWLLAEVERLSRLLEVKEALHDDVIGFLKSVEWNDSTSEANAGDLIEALRQGVSCLAARKNADEMNELWLAKCAEVDRLSRPTVAVLIAALMKAPPRVRSEVFTHFTHEGKRVRP